MLVVTVAVLQLREVVHPALLYRLIRPHDPNQNLLRALLEDPLPRHAKRMLVSTTIYVLLVALFVTLPLWMVRGYERACGPEFAPGDSTSSNSSPRPTWRPGAPAPLCSGRAPPLFLK